MHTPTNKSPTHIRHPAIARGRRHVAVVHRLALYDDQDAIVNIISQTDIVRFLSMNRRVACVSVSI
jgi:CBS-domain-containing membrane protein